MSQEIKTEDLIHEILMDQDFGPKVTRYKNEKFFTFLQKVIQMMKSSEKRDLSNFRFTYSMVYKELEKFLKENKGIDITTLSQVQIEQSISEFEFLSAILLITDFEKTGTKIEKEKLTHYLSENPKVAQESKRLKEEFIEDTGYEKKISETDFLGVVLMVPALAIAMADGVIDYFENRYLSIKGREYSKGSYLPFMDPVVNMLEFLAKHLDRWERRFLELNRLIFEELLDHEENFKEPTLFKPSFSRVFDGPDKLVDPEFDEFFEELLDMAEKRVFKTEFGVELKDVSLHQTEGVMAGFRYWDLTMECMKWDLAGLALPYFIGESIIRSLFFRKDELKSVEKQKVSEVMEILGLKKA